MKFGKPQIFFTAVAVIAAVSVISVIAIIEKNKNPKIEDPEKEIALGWLRFKMGEYNQALKIFGKVLKAVPDKSEYRPQALYGLGCTQWLKLSSPDKPSAATTFRDVIARFPDSDYAVWSMLALVRMKHIVPSSDIPDYPVIRKAYLEIYEKFPNHMAGQEALMYMISTYLATFTEEDTLVAKKRLLEFFEKHPDSTFLSLAWSLYSRACDTLGEKQEQLHAMIKGLEAKERDPMNPLEEEGNASSYWSIAVVAEFEVGDFDTARKYFKLLIDKCPHDKRSFGAETEIKKMNALEEEQKSNL